MKYITKSKTKIVFSVLGSILILYFCFRYYQLYKGFVAALFFFLFAFFHIELPHKARKIRFLHYFVIIVLSFAFSSLVLFGNFSLLQNMTNNKMALNVLGILALCLLFYTAFLGERLSVLTGTGIYLALFIINTFVLRFRGREITPLDIRSIKTAMNVAGSYEISLNFPQFWGIVLWSVSVISLWTISYANEPDNPDNETVFIAIRRRVLPLFLTSLTLVFFCFECSKTDISLWGVEGTQKNGFLVNFTANMLSDAKIRSYPAYSLSNVAKLEKEYNDSESVCKNDDLPSILVIMDEAFSDLRLLDKQNIISENVTPFFDSLKENTIKGYALTSVFGGNTANSEYEFLTGNTLGFISTNAVVYQQLLDGNYYSMASILNKLGYASIGTHPYLSTSWQRDQVFPMLGFNTSIFMDEYPQNDLIRYYISDHEMFDKIIELYEQTPNSKNLFLFGVTVQNHGDYTSIVGPEIPIHGLSRQYPDAEQYLGLIHETDSALEKLITYFKTIDEKVVVVFYGDHLPNLDPLFYDEIYGKSFDTLDDQQMKFMVPFFIWANYDIEEKTLPCTSLNFLSNYVYEAAGIQAPPYNRFLKDVESVIPAMNAYGYYSKENNSFMKYDNAQGKEKDILEKYRTLQYNSLFDQKNTSSTFFPLN